LCSVSENQNRYETRWCNWIDWLLFVKDRKLRKVKDYNTVLKKYYNTVIKIGARHRIIVRYNKLRFKLFLCVIICCKKKLAVVKRKLSKRKFRDSCQHLNRTLEKIRSTQADVERSVEDCPCHGFWTVVFSWGIRQMPGIETWEVLVTWNITVKHCSFSPCLKTTKKAQESKKINTLLKAWRLKTRRKFEEPEKLVIFQRDIRNSTQ